jgi:hypothetical protein
MAVYIKDLDKYPVKDLSEHPDYQPWSKILPPGAPARCDFDCDCPDPDNCFGAGDCNLFCKDLATVFYKDKGFCSRHWNSKFVQDKVKEQ